MYASPEDDYDSYKLEITLLEVYRGGGALKKIKEADSYNDIPEEGKEYLLAKFEVSALQSNNDEAIDIAYAFDVVKSDGGMYSDSYSFAMGLEELSTMYQGSTQEGYVSFLVDKNDKDLLIVFPRYSKSQVWFSGAQTAGKKDDNYNPLGDPNRLGSKNNPAKINETANYNGTDLSISYYAFSVDITITEVFRGQKALEKVMSADSYNDIPPAGKEYLIAKVKIEAISSRSGDAIDISTYDFKLFSANGIEYSDRAYVYGLDDSSLSQMYPGATQEGHLSFLVDTSDINPSIVAFSDSDIPVWFSFPQSKSEQNQSSKNSGQRTAQTEAWALGCSAVFAVANGHDPYKFGMFEKNAANATIARYILHDSWNCDNRDDLIKTVLQMTTSGHNESFAEAYSVTSLLSDQDIKMLMEKNFEDDKDKNTVLMVLLTKTLGDKWGDKQLKAWDWFRMIHLVGWGYVAGFIELQEAYDYMAPVIERINSTFSSWDDAVGNYLDGYAWWSQTDISAPDTEYKLRVEIYERIKSDRTLFDPTVWS